MSTVKVNDATLERINELKEKLKISKTLILEIAVGNYHSKFFKKKEDP
ncbi:unnamed protein product [marine sediment metagenome]|uniref:Uncharacterized protein n=1 Tax=marine sediment metagenome TaxID=412755 RepID=X1D789_9ZZZZ